MLYVDTRSLVPHVLYKQNCNNIEFFAFTEIRLDVWTDAFHESRDSLSLLLISDFMSANQTPTSVVFCPLKISIRVCASFASVIILFISKRKFNFIPHPNVVKFPQFTPLMCLFLLCVQFCSSSSGSFLPIHRSVYRLKLLNDSKRKRLLLLLKLV